MERNLNKRNYTHEDLLEQLSRFDRLTESEKRILENAVFTIFAIFDKDPNRFEFDFRFSRR